MKNERPLKSETFAKEHIVRLVQYYSMINFLVIVSFPFETLIR